MGETGKTHTIYRIIDANSNRTGEGLRVLEDIARFVLNDISLSRRLKELRHSLVKNLSRLDHQLLSARDSENDIGPAIEAKGTQTDIAALVSANCKRVEEALRSLEELAKLPEISDSIDATALNRARFTVYSIEQELQSLLSRYKMASHIRGIYAIIDTSLPACHDIDAAVEAVIKGGARTIQLRDSFYSKNERYKIALKMKEICQQNNILFIVNNDLDIALATGADGVHLGQDDLPVTIARTLLPVNRIIGCSTHNLQQALTASKDGADYIGVGSIFPTSTKQDATQIGLNALREIKAKVSIPVVAIGGINAENVLQVIDAGADAVAVISAILSQDNIEKATREMVERLV